MTGPTRYAPIQPRRGLAILLSLATAWLAWRGLSGALPPGEWLDAAFHADHANARRLLFAESLLPRLVMGFLAGAALGLAGSVFQHLFRNPLADPALLGVASGAQLTLTLALLFAPNVWAFGPEPIAWTGAGIALSIVFTLSAKQRFASDALLLSGLIVNLYLGALASLLILFNHDFLTDLLLWQAGTLNQSGWSGVSMVGSRLAVFCLVLFALGRPLQLLELGDAQSRSLGSRIEWIRVGMLLAASALVASVIGSTGLIGFIGLAAPHLARALGFARRSFSPVAAMFVGGLVLCSVDQAVREISLHVGEIPTGSVVAVLAGPLLILLLPKLPTRRDPPGKAAVRPAPRNEASLVNPVIILMAMLALNLFAARMRDGWSFDPMLQWTMILEWRGERIIAALTAGAGLALAGLLLQRVTTNPLASPELLGISQGAGLGLVLAALLVPQAGALGVLTFTAGGAITALAIVVTISFRLRGEPQQGLLAGIAVGGIASGVTTFFLASGDPRVASLLSWFSGSLGRVQNFDTNVLTAIFASCLTVTIRLHRGLDGLALGRSLAQGVGLPVGRIMIVSLVTAGIMTAAATVMVGPISFVGLLAPHIVRMAGFRGCIRQSVAAALTGAILLSAADWFGRNFAYPWPLSAGLLSTFLGGPYLLIALSKKKRS